MKIYHKYTPKQKQNTSRNNDLFFAHNTQVGDYGETYVSNILAYSGYYVQKTAHIAYSGDIRTINPQTGVIATIEVKTAVRDAKGKYKFCLAKPGHTDYRYSDYVILVCLDSYNCHYIYVIPTSCITTNHLTVTSHPLRYAGKYAKFRVSQKINLEISYLVGVQ